MSRKSEVMKLFEQNIKFGHGPTGNMLVSREGLLSIFNRCSLRLAKKRRHTYNMPLSVFRMDWEDMREQVWAGAYNVNVYPTVEEVDLE